jgi:hypothetical protein
MITRKPKTLEPIDRMNILYVQSIYYRTGSAIVMSHPGWAMCTINCAGLPMPNKSRFYRGMATQAGVAPALVLYFYWDKGVEAQGAK